MFKVDYNFTYKNVLRNLLINKSNSIQNTYGIGNIDKIIVTIPIIDKEDVDAREGYNYCYLFKFFFGKRAYLSHYESNYHLGVWDYKMKIGLTLRKKEIYTFLFFYINDVLYKIDKSYISYGLFNKSLNIFYILLKDLNIFSEKKTNLGLFNLKSVFNSHIYLKGCHVEDSYILLKMLKIKIHVNRKRF